MNKQWVIVHPPSWELHGKKYNQLEEAIKDAKELALITKTDRHVYEIVGIAVAPTVDIIQYKTIVKPVPKPVEGTLNYALQHPTKTSPCPF